MRVLPLLFLLLMLSAPIPALAADKWEVGSPDVPVAIPSSIKATATLYYTNPDTASNVVVKYDPTEIYFYLNRGVTPLKTSFRLKGGTKYTVDIQASMKGLGFKSGVTTTVVASCDETAPVFSEASPNDMSWTYDAVDFPEEVVDELAVFASSVEGSFKEGVTKNTVTKEKEPNGMISFKLTYIIAGTLDNGYPGRLVVVLTGKNLAGQ